MEDIDEEPCQEQKLQNFKYENPARLLKRCRSLPNHLNEEFEDGSTMVSKGTISWWISVPCVRKNIRDQTKSKWGQAGGEITSSGFLDLFSAQDERDSVESVSIRSDSAPSSAVTTPTDSSVYDTDSESEKSGDTIYEVQPQVIVPVPNSLTNEVQQNLDPELENLLNKMSKLKFTNVEQSCSMNLLPQNPPSKPNSDSSYSSDSKVDIPGNESTYLTSALFEIIQSLRDLSLRFGGEKVILHNLSCERPSLIPLLRNIFVNVDIIRHLPEAKQFSWNATAFLDILNLKISTLIQDVENDLRYRGSYHPCMFGCRKVVSDVIQAVWGLVDDVSNAYEDYFEN